MGLSLNVAFRLHQLTGFDVRAIVAILMVSEHEVPGHSAHLPDLSVHERAQELIDALPAQTEAQYSTPHVRYSQEARKVLIDLLQENRWLRFMLEGG